MTMSAGKEHEKHKDDQPANTINRIRRILQNLDILTVEHWFQSGDSMYSVRVEIAGTNIGQNGKGTTQEYALASAYGEFIERLQVGTLYQSADLGSAALMAEGFYYAPDEVYASVEHLLENGGPVVDFLLAPGAAKLSNSTETESIWADKMTQWFGRDDQEIKRALLIEWAGETAADCRTDFICLPYYSLKDERLFSIPVQMLRLPYLHNGAAAGNTPEEALVQAMSEVLERYVHKQIMTGKVTPPDIPREYLEENSRLADMLNQLENHGFNVMVKDCSLNLGIPIVGVIIVDQRCRSYFVKFGVHPSFEVALERCLTEVAQGRNLFGANRDWMTRFQYNDEAALTPLNAYNVVRTGAGSYPESFLANNSCLFSGYPTVEHLSNQALLKQLTAILLKLGGDVLIRDLSYLGFSTYQVIVPGISEVFEYDSTRLRLEKFRREVRQIAKNLPTASTSQLNKVVSYLVKRAGFVFETDCLGQLPGIALRLDFHWNKTPNYEFIGAALYKMGKTAEAAGIMRQLAHSPSVKTVAGLELYYSAITDYLAARAEGHDELKTRSLMTVFYGIELVTSVEEQWQDPQKVLDKFTTLPCWDCQACPAQESCSSQKLLAIHKKFKKEQVCNPIDQMRMQQIFMQ